MRILSIHHVFRPHLEDLVSIHTFTSITDTRCVTRRKPQTPGTAEEHQRQETPTISPNDRQPAQLTDQAPGTIYRAAQESRRTTSTSTAAVHASSTATNRHHHPHPTGSPPDPPSQRSPLRSTDGLSRTTTQNTPHLSGDTQRPPPGGGHYQEWLMNSQRRTASLRGGEGGRGAQSTGKGLAGGLKPS